MVRDIHCHILPGVDDGARDINESLAMLEAARSVGITSIVCTPHARKPYFDYDAMWNAFRQLNEQANGFPLRMGFEVHHQMLLSLGEEWIDLLAFQGPGPKEFLYEFSSSFSYDTLPEYQRQIYEIQRRGYTVIVAHPERYRAIQRDIDLAYELVDMGCLLQASADFVSGGRLGREKRPAKRLFAAQLYTYIASDAHHADHYRNFDKAIENFDTIPAGRHALSNTEE